MVSALKKLVKPHRVEVSDIAFKVSWLILSLTFMILNISWYVLHTFIWSMIFIHKESKVVRLSINRKVKLYSNTSTSRGPPWTDSKVNKDFKSLGFLYLRSQNYLKISKFDFSGNRLNYQVDFVFRSTYIFLDPKF